MGPCANSFEYPRAHKGDPPKCPTLCPLTLTSWGGPQILCARLFLKPGLPHQEFLGASKAPQTLKGAQAPKKATDLNLPQFKTRAPTGAFWPTRVSLGNFLEPFLEWTRVPKWPKPIQPKPPPKEWCPFWARGPWFSKPPLTGGFFPDPPTLFVGARCTPAGPA